MLIYEKNSFGKTDVYLVSDADILCFKTCILVMNIYH